MNTPIFVDLETYWAQDYTLSDMTTEAYVRDSKFKIHMAGIKSGREGDIEIVPGPKVKEALQDLNYTKRAAVAHHAFFDLYAIKHVYGLSPAWCVDTVSMSRWALGRKLKSHSLAQLAKSFGFPEKGGALVKSKGVYNLPGALYQEIAAYCRTDVALLSMVYHSLRPDVSTYAMDLIDWAIRCYLEPSLKLNSDVLLAAMAREETERQEVLDKLYLTDSDLKSKERFAELLKSYGCSEADIPLKRSPRTNKLIYAFAKTDAGFQKLRDHPNPTIRHLVEARLRVNSSIVPTRLARLHDISTRGLWPIQLNTAGAQNTGRFSGGDKVNPQNLNKKGAVREAVEAPEGYVLVVVDSSNIEPRILGEIGKVKKLQHAFRNAIDPYKVMAGAVYSIPVFDIPDSCDERQLGKILVLSCGYGTGLPKFIDTVRQWGLDIDQKILAQAHAQYRFLFPEVPALWERCDHALRAILRKNYTFRIHDQVELVPEGVLLKGTGFVIKFPNLQYDAIGHGRLVYGAKDDPYTHFIYGASLVESLCQGLAGMVIGEQIRILRRLYRIPLMVHDEIVMVVRKDQAQTALKKAIEVMSTPPKWWPDLPLAAKGSICRKYSEAK